MAASPGTYDQKHVVRIANVAQCVAYGPGLLTQAHQPDEYCFLEDIVTSAKIMAMTAIDLLGLE
jgi:succinyl-diaminopimelate desuccinylase